MINEPSSPELRQDVVLLRLQLLGNQPPDAFPNHLLGRETEDTSSTRVPANDRPIKILAHDRVTRGRHNRGQIARLIDEEIADGRLALTRPGRSVSNRH